MEHIQYKDNERYMSINYDGKPSKWICRLYFNGLKKYITIPNEQKKEERHDIESVYELENIKDKLISIAKMHI